MPHPPRPSLNLGLFLLLLSLGAGCQENHPPEILGLAPQTAYVGLPFELTILAGDTDGDDLRWSFECPTLNLKNRARLVALGNEARFSFTPIASDLGQHQLDIIADDGKDEDREVVLVTVKASPAQSSAPLFIKPLGDGTTLDQKTSQCLKLEVEVEDNDSAKVNISQGTPVIIGGTLQSLGTHSAMFDWCPSAAQASTQRHLLRLVADDGDNPPVEKSYAILILTDLRTNCPGAAPVIGHTHPGDQKTLKDISILATVSDDKGLKGSPVVYYTTTAPSGSVLDVTKMSLATMTAASGSSSYSASLPNPVKGSASGTQKTLYYVIVAEDNDDTAGNCDHRTLSPSVGTYHLTVTVPSLSTCTATSQCLLDTVCDGTYCIPDTCTPKDTNGDKLYHDQNDCPTSHFCPAAGPALSPSHCARTCTKDSDCQSGARCKVFDTKKGCGRPGYNVIGQPCTSFNACDGAAMCLPWTKGYCSLSDCDSLGGFSGVCPKGSACIPVTDKRFTTTGKHWICLQLCSSDTNCRFGDGYHCNVIKDDLGNSTKVCM